MASPLIFRSSSPQRQQFVFHEYQRPAKKEGEEVEQEEKEGMESTDPPEAHKPPISRATRGWKVVQAKTILTKRKYVKRQLKAQSVGERGTGSGQEAAPPDSPAGQARSLSWPSPEADIRSGGLRGDPFNAFWEHGPTVSGALDFLITEIGPVAIPGMRSNDGFSPKASMFVHLGMEHELVFHAVVAFARGYSEVANTGTTEPSQAVLYHRGRATQGLSARLRDPKTRADDASILTTFLLVDNVWRYGENEIGRAHYAGLAKMLEMRGGLDNLGSNPALKAMIDFAEVTDIGDTMRSSSSPALPDLRYYQHPFPPSVCGLIARLPDGYADMALQGHLSVETMATIVSFRDWLATERSERTPCPHKQIGAARRCMTASKPPTGTLAEEAVCFGIVLTGMRTFHARFARMDHPFLDRIVDLGAQFDHAHSTATPAERQHLAYLTLVAVEASDRCIELQPHVKTLVELVLRREKFARSWEGMERVVKRFFWIPFAAKHWKECWLKHLRRRHEAETAARAREALKSASTAIWHAMERPES